MAGLLLIFKRVTLFTKIYAMKPLLCALALVCMPLLLSAQKGWVVDFNLGTSLPVGIFEDSEDAKGGFALQAGATYRFGKIFGLGMRVGLTSNPFDSDAIRNGLVEGISQPVETVDGGSYTAFNFMLAPQLGYFGEQFHIALVPQAGIQSMADLESTYQTAVVNTDVEIFIDQSHDSSTLLGIGLLMGTRLTEQLELSMFVNYLTGYHDANLFFSVSDGTTTVADNGRTELDYNVLQLMVQAGYRF